MSTAAWEQLPDDVWAQVFSCLLPPDWWVEDEVPVYRQWELLSMQLVCRKFRSVFTANPSLCCNLALHKQYDNQQFKAMVQWVKQHASAITHLSAKSWSQRYLETPLTVMQHDHKLIIVSAYMPSPYAISLLANVRTLTRCTFVRSHNHVSLEALASLPGLSTLSLDHADMQGIETLPNLTSLRLNNSNIACSRSMLCITALLQLDVTASSIAQLHDCGVLACSHLESLMCVHGVIEAADAALRLRTNGDDSAAVPANLAALSSLTSLVLIGSRSYQINCLTWASKLVSLQSLAVHLPSVIVRLSKSIAALTNLTCLSIDAKRFDGDLVPVLVFDIEWTAFHMLKSACFTGAVRCSYNRSLYSLAALHNLKSLIVCDMCFEGQDTYFAQEAWTKFSHWLGVHRPTLHFHYRLEGVSKVDFSSDDLSLDHDEFNSKSSGSEADDSDYGSDDSSVDEEDDYNSVSSESASGLVGYGYEGR